MKILHSKISKVAIALLMLLSLSAVAGMTSLVNASSIKDHTVFVDGSGSVELTWKSGKSQAYSSDAYANLGGLVIVTFIPTHGWHVATVLVDGIPQGILDEDGFSLTNVRAKSMISVTFVKNPGVDDVDIGSHMESYPDPYVGLIFDIVLADGFAYAGTVELQYPDQKSASWDVQTDAIFDQSVTVILVLNLLDLGGADPFALRLYRTEYELARADVNLDREVNGTDVSIVANANPSELGDPIYNPRLDQNGNGAIDNVDVNIVNNYIGETVWELLESWVIVDNDLVYVYGVTDHLSLFGVH